WRFFSCRQDRRTSRFRWVAECTRGCEPAVGPGWRSPPALAALRCAPGSPRWRTSRGRRRKLGAARLKHASPCLPRDALRLGAPEVGARQPGPTASPRRLLDLRLDATYRAAITASPCPAARNPP